MMVMVGAESVSYTHLNSATQRINFRITRLCFVLLLQCDGHQPVVSNTLRIYREFEMSSAERTCNKAHFHSQSTVRIVRPNYPSGS